MPQPPPPGEDEGAALQQQLHGSSSGSSSSSSNSSGKLLGPGKLKPLGEGKSKAAAAAAACSSPSDIPGSPVTLKGLPSPLRRTLRSYPSPAAVQAENNENSNSIFNRGRQVLPRSKHPLTPTSAAGAGGSFTSPSASPSTTSASGSGSSHSTPCSPPPGHRQLFQPATIDRSKGPRLSRHAPLPSFSPRKDSVSDSPLMTRSATTPLVGTSLPGRPKLPTTGSGSGGGGGGGGGGGSNSPGGPPRPVAPHSPLQVTRAWSSPSAGKLSPPAAMARARSVGNTGKKPSTPPPSNKTVPTRPAATTTPKALEDDSAPSQKEEIPSPPPLQETGRRRSLSFPTEGDDALPPPLPPPLQIGSATSKPSRAPESQQQQGGSDHQQRTRRLVEVLRRMEQELGTTPVGGKAWDECKGVEAEAASYPAEVLAVWSKVQEEAATQDRPKAPVAEDEHQSDATTVLLGPGALRGRIQHDFGVKLPLKEMSLLVQFFASSSLSSSPSSTVGATSPSGSCSLPNIHQQQGPHVDYAVVRRFLEQPCMPQGPGKEAVRKAPSSSSSAAATATTNASLMSTRGFGPARVRRSIVYEEAARSEVAHLPKDEASQALVERLAEAASWLDRNQLDPDSFQPRQQQPQPQQGEVRRGSSGGGRLVSLPEFQILVAEGLHLAVSPAEMALLTRWFGTSANGEEETTEKTCVDVTLFLQQVWALGAAAKRRRRKEEAQERFLRALTLTTTEGVGEGSGQATAR